MRLFRPPMWWCPSGGGGTREGGGTFAESLVGRSSALIGSVRNGFGEGGGQLDRRRARGVLNSCARESKVRIERLLRENAISDYGLFSSYKGKQGAVNGQDGAFFRDALGFGRLDAGSRAGFTSSRPPPPWTSVFQFSYFCMTCGLEKFGVLIKTDWSVICPLCC